MEKNHFKTLEANKRDKILNTLSPKQIYALNEFRMYEMKSQFHNNHYLETTDWIFSGVITDRSFHRGKNFKHKLHCDCGRPVKHLFILQSKSKKRKVLKLGITHFQDHINIPLEVIKEIKSGINQIQLYEDYILSRYANGSRFEIDLYNNFYIRGGFDIFNLPSLEQKCELFRNADLPLFYRDHGTLLRYYKKIRSNPIVKMTRDEEDAERAAKLQREREKREEEIRKLLAIEPDNKQSSKKKIKKTVVKTGYQKKESETERLERIKKENEEKKIEIRERLEGQRCLSRNENTPYTIVFKSSANKTPTAKTKRRTKKAGEKHKRHNKQQAVDHTRHKKRIKPSKKKNYEQINNKQKFNTYVALRINMILPRLEHLLSTQSIKLIGLTFDRSETLNCSCGSKSECVFSVMDSHGIKSNISFQHLYEHSFVKEDIQSLISKEVFFLKKETYENLVGFNKTVIQKALENHFFDGNEDLLSALRYVHNNCYVVPEFENKRMLNYKPATNKINPK